METVVKKWGNSAAIRLPAYVLKESHLKLNQIVDIMVEGTRIVIAAKEKTPRYRLKDLLAGITEANMHKEVDVGPPVGKELL